MKKQDRYLYDKLLELNAVVSDILFYLEKRYKRKKGRPSKINNEIIKGLQGIADISDIAEITGLSKATIYRKLSKK